jgi:uncharacterized membrane protein
MVVNWVGKKSRNRGRVPSPQEKERAKEARRIADRAIRRLDILEYVILLAAALMALVGGALVAWLLTALIGFSYRITWAVSSILLFVIPGGSVYLRELRREKGYPDSGSNSKL